MPRTLSSYIYSGAMPAKVRQGMIKVTIRAVVREDRQLTTALPDGFPIGPVLVTITPAPEVQEIVPGAE
jgi:hypothetical protein